MATSDRWTFLAEWKDPFSSINRQFHLFFYPSDETLEMYDLSRHRLFLKRTKCDGISADDLFVGATVRIYSRQIHIKDYGDAFTRTKFESSVQKTCGFLKPEIGNKKGEILKILQAKNFKIINLKTVLFEETDVCEIFNAYEDQEILKSIAEYLVGEPVVAFQLLAPDAVTRLLDLAGPEDPSDAKSQHPESLRAIYGTDRIRNAVYVSESAESADKDFSILFSKVPFAFMKNTTCCVIKPHAVKEGQTGDIINMIEEFNYEVTGLNMCTLNVEQAEKFYEIYKYFVSEYRDMVEELCSGACIALEVRGRGEKETILNFRELVGPLDLEAAKLLRPHSIRAKFGKSKVQNSVHVTDLIDDAAREVTTHSGMIECFFATKCLGGKMGSEHWSCQWPLAFCQRQNFRNH